jgi:ABC-type dipeptide/oligopeptide/nickel transport system ATPase subunit
MDTCKYYKYVTCFSSEKYDDPTKKGGLIYKRIDYNNDGSFEIQKKAIQEKQKLENNIYRTNNPIPKKGPEKRIPRKVAGEISPTDEEQVPNNNFGVNKLQGKSLFANTINYLPKLKLDPNTGNSLVLIASSKSGKSTILNRIYNQVYKDKKKQIEIVFSVNSHAEVYDHFPRKKLVNKFDKDCENLINQMKKVNMVTKNKFDYLIILDDIIDQKYSSMLNNLILTYRNSNFSSIISLQYAYLLNKGSRASINQVILGHMNSDESIESIVKSYLASTFSKLGYHQLQSQIQLYRELTADYHFLYFFPRTQLLIRFKLDISKD